MMSFFIIFYYSSLFTQDCWKLVQPLSELTKDDVGEIYSFTNMHENKWTITWAPVLARLFVVASVIKKQLACTAWTLNKYRQNNSVYDVDLLEIICFLGSYQLSPLFMLINMYWSSQENELETFLAGLLATQITFLRFCRTSNQRQRVV